MIVKVNKSLLSRDCEVAIPAYNKAILDIATASYDRHFLIDNMMQSGVCLYLNSIFQVTAFNAPWFISATPISFFDLKDITKALKDRVDFLRFVQEKAKDGIEYVKYDEFTTVKFY